MSQVEFYFDFSCPWSYLALVRLRDVAERNGAKILFRPVSVDTVLATEKPSLQATRLAENPAKAAWQRKDLAHWARLWGLRLRLHDNWPFVADQAAAAMVAADAAGKGMPFAMALFGAHFGSGTDIDSVDSLLKIATGVGLHSKSFRKQLESPATAEQVQGYTQELIRRGGFGTPSMFVNDELFFGNDRIPLVEWTIGPVSDADFVLPGQHSKY